MTASTLYLLYALLAAGVGGLYLCLPSTREDSRRLRVAGGIVASAAVAALAVYWVGWIGDAVQGRPLFILFAIIAVAAAARVVMHPKPVYAAIYFVLVVLSVSGLSVLAAAEFLGVALIIVYGGAILVTYVFVIMLAQQGGEASYDRRAREPFAATAMGFALVAAATQAMSVGHVNRPGTANDNPEHAIAAGVATHVPVRTVADESNGSGTHADESQMDPAPSNVRAIGESLMTTHVVAVEVAGVLLLIAMVGAIVIAQKRIEPEDLTPAERAERCDDPGRAGREAKPF